MQQRLKPYVERLRDAEIARARERSTDPWAPKERVAIRDQRALLNVDPRRILIGEVEVIDDREPPPR
jgi:hypothetical protein